VLVWACGHGCPREEDVGARYDYCCALAALSRVRIPRRFHGAGVHDDRTVFNSLRHHIYTKKHRLAQYNRSITSSTFPRTMLRHARGYVVNIEKERGGRRRGRRRRRRRRDPGVVIIEKQGWKPKPSGRRSWLSRSGLPPPPRGRTPGSGSPWPPPPPHARSTRPCWLTSRSGSPARGVEAQVNIESKS